MKRRISILLPILNSSNRKSSLDGFLNLVVVKVYAFLTIYPFLLDF